MQSRWSSFTEGAELQIGAGQLYEVPPGHDTWVVGDEPWITIEWQPSTAFARMECGGLDRVMATLLVTDIGNSTAHALEVRAAVHTGEIELEGGNVRGATMHISI